jgi:ribose/xylose/arabinose/galactoside ABC-type transport system permease subunit
MINGLAIAYTRIPPFIVTLGMLSVARGVALEATSIYHGQSVAAGGAQPVSSIQHGSFIFISQGTLIGVPFPAYLAVGVFLALAYTLRYTRFGRHVFALGGNEAAADLLGVRVARVKIAIYTFSGLLSGFAGVLLASRLVRAAHRRAGLGARFHHRCGYWRNPPHWWRGYGPRNPRRIALHKHSAQHFNLTGVDPPGSSSSAVVCFWQW